MVTSAPLPPTGPPRRSVRQAGSDDDNMHFLPVSRSGEATFVNSPSGVGSSTKSSYNSSDAGIARDRAQHRVAGNESPPSSKKSGLTSTSWIPSTRRKISTIELRSLGRFRALADVGGTPRCRPVDLPAGRVFQRRNEFHSGGDELAGQSRAQEALRSAARGVPGRHDIRGQRGSPRLCSPTTTDPTTAG